MVARDKLRIELTAQNRASGAFRQLRADIDRTGRAMRRLTGLAAGAFGGFAAGNVLQGIIGVNREFQRLSATMETFVGRAKSAQIMKIIQDYARTTPESLASVTQAFNRLVSAGLTPAITNLRAFGNIASGSGKRTIDFVEAVADAVMGEFERLKEFGIKASKQGDSIAFTFKGVTTSVKATARDVESYLVRLGQVQFAGALDRQAVTLDGAFSNLRDSAARFATAIGDGGLNAALSDVSHRLSAMIGAGDGLAQSIGQGLAAAVRAGGDAFEWLGRTIAFVHDNELVLGRALAAFVLMRIGARIIGWAVAFARLARAMRITGLAGLFLKRNTFTTMLTFVAFGGVVAKAAGQLDAYKASIGSFAREMGDIGAKLWSNMSLSLPPQVKEFLGLDLSAFETELRSKAIPAADDLDAQMRKLLGHMRAADTAIGSGASSASKHVRKLGKPLNLVRHAAKETEDAFASFRDTMSSTFADGLARIVTGAGKIKDVFRDMARSIISSAIRTFMNAAVQKLFGGLFGGLAGGVLGGGGFGQLRVGTGGLYAHGGVFAGGREVTAFARGGVVSRPALFPMARGAGLMGEAGPEAIMPLARGPDGRLGVRAAGQGTAVTITMNITTPDAEGFRRNRGRIAAELARAVAEGRRNL